MCLPGNHIDFANELAETDGMPRHDTAVITLLSFAPIVRNNSVTHGNPFKVDGEVAP